MFRAVVDTNVFVTALLRGPTPRRIYEAFLRGKLILIFSPETLSELTEVLTRPSLRVLMSEREVDQFLRLVQQDSIVVQPGRRVRACRDPKDNPLLEAALAAKADAIVTGDRDLLVLHPFRGISILRPSDFLSRLSR